MNRIRDADRPLVLRVSETRPDPVPEHPANHKANARKSPDRTNADRTQMVHLFAEQAEQNLRRTAAARPAHIDHRDSGNEWHRAHIDDPLAVVAPARRIGPRLHAEAALRRVDSRNT